MRNEQHGQAKFLAQGRQQIEDLRLNSYVERGRGFVGDEQFGPVNDGHGDHHALAHAPRKLVRIISGAACGIGNGNLIQCVHRVVPCFPPRDLLVNANCFGDLLAHPHYRIERGHRFLENHGNP